MLAIECPLDCTNDDVKGSTVYGRELGGRVDKAVRRSQESRKELVEAELNSKGSHKFTTGLLAARATRQK